MVLRFLRLRHNQSKFVETDHYTRHIRSSRVTVVPFTIDNIHSSVHDHLLHH